MTNNEVLDLVKKSVKVKLAEHAEICDYAQHLQFHYDGYQPPHNKSINSIYNQNLDPYNNNWDWFNDKLNIWFARLILMRRPGEDVEIMNIGLTPTRLLQKCHWVK